MIAQICTFIVFIALVVLNAWIIAHFTIKLGMERATFIGIATTIALIILTIIAAMDWEENKYK